MLICLEVVFFLWSKHLKSSLKLHWLPRVSPRGAETRRPLIAVAGDANLSAGHSEYDERRVAAAEALGCALVDAGARVVTGGKVMAPRIPDSNPVKLITTFVIDFTLVFRTPPDVRGYLFIPLLVQAGFWRRCWQQLNVLLSSSYMIYTHHFSITQ